MMVWGLIILLVLVPAIIASWGCEYVTFDVELNRLNSAYYKLGITFQTYQITDEITMESVDVDDLTIGLFFLNVSFKWYRMSSF